ncbi:MAG: hypothetical protein QM820_58115 [Minicystis sp.]
MSTFKMRVVAFVLIALSGAFMAPGCVTAADMGGSGGESNGGGSGGGGGGEDISVAQQAETLCCCTAGPDGSMMSCGPASGSDCPPYTTNTPGACGADTPTGGCSTTSVHSSAGGAVEVFVLLLALAAFRAMRRRFA